METITLENDHLKVTLDGHRPVVRGCPWKPRMQSFDCAGIEREWVLPRRFRGRGPAPVHRLERDSVTLQLPPRTPVKIALARPER